MRPYFALLFVFGFCSCEPDEQNVAPEQELNRNQNEARSARRLDDLDGRLTMERPEARLAAADQLGEEELRGEVRELLEADVERGLYEIGILEKKLNYDVIGEEVYAFLSEHYSAAEALELFSRVDDNASVAAPFLHKFITDLATEDTAAAVDWLVEHDEANGVELAAAALGGQLVAELGAGPDLDLGSAVPSVQSAFYAGVAQALIDTDFEKAYDYFSNQEPSPAMNEAFYTLAVQGAEHDPEAAMSWATTLTDEGLRQSSVLAIARQWRAEGEAAYLNWKETSGLPAELLSELP